MIQGISSAIPALGFSPMSSPTKTLAITLLVLATLSNIPKVSAGPVAYSQCCAATGPWGMLACLPLLLVPGP